MLLFSVLYFVILFSHGFGSFHHLFLSFFNVVRLPWFICYSFFSVSHLVYLVTHLFYFISSIFSISSVLHDLSFILLIFSFSFVLFSSSFVLFHFIYFFPPFFFNVVLPPWLVFSRRVFAFLGIRRRGKPFSPDIFFPVYTF